jgi:polyisoprenoid-binding protein YceI
MKRLSALSFSLSLVVAAVALGGACSKAEQAPEQPGLPVAVVAAEAPAAAAAADAVVLGFDQSSSKIGFTGKKVTGAHTGSFGTFSGEVRLGKDPAQSSVTLTIDMASVASDNEKLTGHLKSADFFDAATFPQATFTSTSITAGGEGGATHTIKGNLALHGVTKNVAFPATLTTSPDKVTLKAAFAFDRKAFNINYPGKADDLIKDHVDLFLDVSAAPKAAAATPPAPEGTPPAAPADGAATPPAGGAAPAPAGG